MFRSFKIVASFSVLAALVACGGSSVDGAPGKSALSSLTPEPAGAECPAGGTRVATGLDLDGNGVLDEAEVKSSQLLCNGASGKDGKDGAAGNAGSGVSSLVNIDAEPQGANCAGGGTRVQSGLDADGDRLLEPSEVTSTRYICNGAQTPSSEAVSLYNPDTVNVGSPTPVTVLSAKIDAPGKGKVIALSNADLFCASPAIGQGHDCATSGTTRGYFTLATSASANPASGSFDFFYVTPNSTDNTARTAVFDVGAAGEVNVYLRASATAGQYGFFRTSLTLLFIPE